MTPGELVDLMVPGDGTFPSASAVGVHGLLHARLSDIGGEDALALLADPSGPEALAALERDRPDLFVKLRAVVYLAYYEMPAVQDAIRSLGHAYNEAPLPKGYDTGRFDPAQDTPTHGRGHYVRTEDVKRLDLSGLDFLGDDHA